MEFIVVHAGLRGCEATGSCLDWISAEGAIDDDSPSRLEKILKGLGQRQLPIIVQSPGGRIEAAMRMGEIIRKRGLSIAVGHTFTRQCDLMEPACQAKLQNREVDANLSPVGYCLSACPFLLAGGVRRIADNGSWIGVHQMTTIWQQVRVQYRIRYRVVNGHREIISREETGRSPAGQRKTTEVAPQHRARMLGYLHKMGVNRSIFDLMLETPATSMHRMTTEEIWSVGILTETSNAARLVMEELPKWRPNRLQPFGPFDLRGPNAPTASRALARAMSPRLLPCRSIDVRRCGLG